MLSQIEAQPPAGRSVAMAYRSYGSSPTAVGHVRVWEELRKEARKLEGELDVKLAAYAKLCSGFESSYRNKADKLGTDQLAQTKSSEIRSLLQRLSDVNDEMGGAIGGSGDARSHTLARHRDILQEFTQEFRRLDSSLGAARDRADLMGLAGENTPLLSVQIQSSTGALLRERTLLQSSTAKVDEVLAQAQSVTGSLLDQRRVFESVQSNLATVGEKFPVIRGLLNAIRRKKSKDTLILAGVIAFCIVFTLIYLSARR